MPLSTNIITRPHIICQYFFCKVTTLLVTKILRFLSLFYHFPKDLTDGRKKSGKIGGFLEN